MGQDFLKGFVAGAITTLAVTYFMKRPAARHSSFNAVSEWKTNGPQKLDPARVVLKRDQNTGDPAALTSARTGATAGFERAGGAPGGSSPAESSEAPGHPGRALEYSDPHTPVKPASRTLHLTKEPAPKPTRRKASPKRPPKPPSDLPPNLPPNLPKTNE
jgi:hypothetical protein